LIQTSTRYWRKGASVTFLTTRPLPCELPSRNAVMRIDACPERLTAVSRRAQASIQSQPGIFWPPASSKPPFDRRFEGSATAALPPLTTIGQPRTGMPAARSGLCWRMLPEYPTGMTAGMSSISMSAAAFRTRSRFA